jgi:hypothetical protein
MSAKKKTGTPKARKKPNPESDAPASTEGSSTTAPQVDAKPSAKKKASVPKSKKLSALDAAAKVLVEAGQPMNTREMIDAMAAKGHWTSPGGKTPHATLHSAILREIGAKGKDARFAKTERGKFAITA